MKHGVKCLALLRRLLAPFTASGLGCRREPNPVVHRGEIELCAGPAHLGVPRSPPAKLTIEQAERFFGIKPRT